MHDGRDAEWRPLLDPDLKVQAVGDESIVLDRGRERVHHLNAVGAFLLGRCDGARTRSEIVEEVVSRYAVEREVAASDVDDFLERMRALGIVS